MMELSSNNSYGFAGKYVRINLSTKEVKIKELDSHLLKNFVGGRGIGSYFLFHEVDALTEALSPDNKLIIATGPLSGTGIAGSTKTAIVTKSPLTGGITYSHASGKFASWLKFAGYDFIIIEGKSERPTWIYLSNGKIEFKDAADLWGLNTMETRKGLAKKINPNISVLCIGPAGENLVRFASTIMDSRESGRGGTGAVLGSKLLKAIVIDPKNKSFQNIYDKSALQDQIKQYVKRVQEDPACQNYKYMGSSRSCRSGNELGLAPTRNYQETYFEDYEKITGEVLAENYITKHNTCYRCPVVCEKVCEVKDGEFAGARSEGLDYETMFAYGSECGNSNLGSIIKAGMLSDYYGLDSISTGVTIGFAMECFEKGILSQSDTDGLVLKWGNYKAILELIEKIAYRKGFGNLLAEGSKRASLSIGNGAEEFSMTVKGQEMSGWDPRGTIGMSLAYGTANRGACHTTAAVFSLEVPSLSGKYGKLLPDPNRVYTQFSIDGKAELVKFVQDNRAAMSALGVCYFVRPLDIDDYANSLSAVTGESCSKQDLIKLGERIYNLERLYNAKSGVTIKDDWLPKRFYEDPVPFGPIKGHKIDRDDYQKMLDEYYELRGWDEKGIPKNHNLIS